MTEEWAKIALEQANRCTDELFQAHRGAYQLYEPDIFVVFGNDGFTNGKPCVKREAEIVRQTIEQDERTTLLAFALDDAESEPGYTWVCLVRSNSPQIGLEELDRLVWNAIRVATMEGTSPGLTFHLRRQAQIAEEVLASVRPLEKPASLK